MTEYVAYFKCADTGYALNADPKKYKRRADPYKAAEDARDHWHKQGDHMVVYAIDGDTARQMDVKVKRSVVVTEVGA